MVTALDKRLPVSSAGKEFPRKAFPDHWSFLLGEIALYSLVVLVVTGVFLTLFGGELPGQEIVPRLYVAHILLIPGLLITLVTVHLGFVIHHKHTQWARPGRTNQNMIGKPMVPQYTAKSVGLFLAGFSLYAVLPAAGGQDVLAYVFKLPFEMLTYTFRVAFFVVPLLMYLITKRVCLGLRAADRRRLLVRDEQRPRARTGTEAWRWFHKHRIRNALSRWYYGRRVEMPVTEWRCDRIDPVRAGPGEADNSDE
jgi:ubiquinol-cytochrome c reductase cytochrome b subunit